MEDQSAQTDALWAEYKTTGERADRDRLILIYAPLVKYVASRVAVGLPHNVEQADLVSYGMFGLIDAIEKFDPERGYKFETYAIARIRGAILDELRSIDWVPRSVRAKARALEQAYAKLENELRRSPTEEEIALELDLTDDQLQANLVADLVHRPRRPRRDARRWRAGRVDDARRHRGRRRAKARSPCSRSRR